MTFSIPRKDTNEIAHLLIERYGSLGRALSAHSQELAQIEGIGEHSAILISLVGAIVKRTLSEKPKVIKLDTPSLAGEFASKILWRNKHEVLYVFCMDKKRNLLHYEKINEGTVGEAVVYPRQVVECAIRHGAHSVIIAHNHPSGDCKPSIEDIDTTESIRKALNSIGINLFDHIVVGIDAYFSFAKRSEFRHELVDEMRLVAAEQEDE